MAVAARCAGLCEYVYSFRASTKNLPKVASTTSVLADLHLLPMSSSFSQVVLRLPEVVCPQIFGSRHGFVMKRSRPMTPVPLLHAIYLPLRRRMWLVWPWCCGNRACFSAGKYAARCVQLSAERTRTDGVRTI